jgi:hypothetical protein
LTIVFLWFGAMVRLVFFILLFILQSKYQLCEAQSFVPFFLDNGNSHQYVGGIYGCGATFCDFDQDGWDDLSLPANGSNPHFYKNMNGTMQTISIPVTNNGGIQPYSVQWSNGDQNTMIADSLDSGMYWVVVSDSNGCAILTDFEIDWITGINESEIEGDLVYPNPASEYLMIELRDAPGDGALVVIFDQSGKIYGQHQLSGKFNMIRVAELPSGNYVATLFHHGIQNNINFIRK